MSFDAHEWGRFVEREASPPQPSLSYEQAAAQNRQSRVERFVRDHREAILTALAPELGQIVSAIFAHFERKQ